MEIIKKLRRKVFAWMEHIIYVYDQCEICREEKSSEICVSCGARICCECESGYYADETLCVKCRTGITPEEEEDREELSAEIEDYDE